MPGHMGPDAWRAAGAYTSSAAHRLFFRDSGGAGPALLLLHGFPTSSWDFHAIWDELARSYRVIAPDYLGFGFSDKPLTRPFTVAGYADQVEGLLGHLQVRDVDVIAHDLGDTVAQELLARGGAGLRSVFFLNGGLFPETHRPRRMQTLLAGPFGFLFARLVNRRLFGRAFSEVFGPRTRPSPEELDAYWACIRSGGGHRLQHLQLAYMRERREQRARWVPPLAERRVPLAFCIGLEDPVSGAHVVARLRRLLEAPRVIELAEIGHYPQVEAPHAVLDAYADFRRELGH